MAAQQEETIPGPWPLPLLGSIHLVDSNAVVQSLMKLQQYYGPIFKLNIVNKEIIVVSSQELVNELCDERRFDKKVRLILSLLLSGSLLLHLLFLPLSLSLSLSPPSASLSHSLSASPLSSSPPLSTSFTSSNLLPDHIGSCPH